MFPFTGLRLLLPALLPSWRFFDVVTASPRLDYAVLATPDGTAEQWREFRLRPAVLTPVGMLRRLLWNAQWNESLFLVSLAERLMSATTADASAHSQRELLLRMARRLDRETGIDPDAYLQIRLRVVGRAGPEEDLSSEIVLLSSPHPISGLIMR